MLATLSWADFGITVFAALATALCVLFAFRMLTPDEPPIASVALPLSGRALSFDFDPTGTLLCTNEAAANLLTDLDLQDLDWRRFQALFADRFPDLPLTPADLSGDGINTFAPCFPADPMEIEVERHAAGTSVYLKNRLPDLDQSCARLHQTLSSLPNLDLIHAVSEQAPFPIWQSFEDGTVGWANARYKSLDAHIPRKEEGVALFDLPDIVGDATKPTRVSLKDTDHNRTYWFDVSRQEFKGGHLNFAVDIHAVINAESAQRNFVQTLAKTFAHLAIGLAIFDRNRQLVLFNPSLIDLTELRPEYLTARPNLFSFFDQLRDQHVMPEPKSYASWRERVADVISAACDDNFNETWHLPNGLTYRVTGRPHPDGAIAFLFEDISAEISLTRRFRGEADITRSAFDALESGIAIFNQAGFLQQSNRAMAGFTTLDEEAQLEQMTLHDITRLWKSRFQPSPVWGEIRDFISGNTERETWTAPLRHKDGYSCILQVSPLTSGATLVTLSLATEERGKNTGHRPGDKQTSTVAA